MKIKLSDLKRDRYGNLEAPVLMLKKPHGEIMGPLGMYHSLTTELKFNEPSVVSFTYPAYVHGVATPFYDNVVKDKLIQIDPIGVFIIASVHEYGDGVKAYKEVSLYSREYELGRKKMVFGEGTYNFWSQMIFDGELSPSAGFGGISFVDSTGVRSYSLVYNEWGRIPSYDDLSRGGMILWKPGTYTYDRENNIMIEDTEEIPFSFNDLTDLGGATDIGGMVVCVHRETSIAGTLASPGVYFASYFESGSRRSTGSFKVNGFGFVPTAGSRAASENSILGMAIGSAPGWRVGYVSPALIGKYRTFDSTDDWTLDFLSTAQETYGAIVIYDSYQRIINAYDADEAPGVMPLYLSYDNLVKENKIDELEERFATKLYVKGGGEVDIREVNPTGDNFIYNIDYYIGNGDIPYGVAKKWTTWQNAIFARQQYYTSLVSLRNSAAARKIVETAKLTDLSNDLASEENVMSVNLQALNSFKKNSEGYNNCQTLLNASRARCKDLEAKVDAQKKLIEKIDEEINEHSAAIAEVNEELSINNPKNFYADDLDVLEHYFRQDTFVDETFAVFDVDITGDDNYAPAENATISFSGVKWTDVPCDGGHRMAAVSGGEITINGTGYEFSAQIIKGTVDHINGELVCSFRVGAGKINGDDFLSGSVTCVCAASYNDDELLASMEKHEDVLTSADGSVSHTAYYYVGDAEISETNGSIYFTRNATEYERYSVQQELYEHAVAMHAQTASPSYEFEVDSANFVADPDYEMFKDNVQLGSTCYLQMNKNFCLSPLLIEIHIDFEDLTNFKLIFANTFRRPDDVNKLKTTLKEISSASQDWSGVKLDHNSTQDTVSWVQNLFISGYQAAMAQIKAGVNNNVTIGSSGIIVDSTDDTYRIHINNGMIALIDKNGDEVKMAMGRFLPPGGEPGKDEFIGVLADVIAGTLLAGKNLVIECPNNDGTIMQFKVDQDGVLLNGGRFYIRTEQGAIGMDATHGFFAGTGDLFQYVDNGVVLPTCVDPETRELLLDDKGYPSDPNVNVWIGVDGKVYVRGTIYAEQGIFQGDVQAARYLDAQGNDMMEEGLWKADYLNLKGLNINNNFIVNEDGEVTINGGSISWNAVTGTDEIDDRINTAQSTADSAKSSASSASSLARRIANGTYSGGTFIDENVIHAPEIHGGIFYSIGTDEETVAVMDDNKFQLTIIDANGNPASQGRAILEAYQSYSRLILGGGSSTEDETRGRGYITKDNDGMRMYYVTQLIGDEIGFTISESDGAIMANGTFCFSDSNYGSKLPSSGVEGQVFFLI